MTVDEIMRKYDMGIDDVLNVQAIYGGMVTIAPDQHLIFFKKCGKLSTVFKQFYRARFE